jgi:hypothetical protein
MTEIEDRLEASIKRNAFNGDDYDRLVCETQAREAVTDLRALRKRITELETYQIPENDHD